MKKFSWVAMVVILVFATVFGFFGKVEAATNVNLGTAGNFAVLGGSGITIAGAVNSTTITGDIGTFPTTSITGIGNVVLNGTNHAGDAVTQGAKDDLVTAYNSAAGQSCDVDLTGQDLGGLTLTPGTYCFSSSAQLTGTLTLDAQGNADAVFIFQIGSALTTASNSNVVMTNSGQACHVFWQITSSATLGTTTDFSGNILALTSITLNNSATIEGRVLARNGAVTLDTNTITRAICDSSSGDDSDDDDEDDDSGDVDISVKKRATPSALYSGPGFVTYTYDVRNEGDGALKFVSVKDDKCSPVKFVSGDGDHDSKLDTNERWRYTCTKLVSETETNTATARGTNGEEVKDTDKVTVTVSVPGLPNAGIGPDEENSSLWEAVIQKVSSILNLL
ncbi:MAG: ice-binding family protein [Candidatus Moraniibacteriota bacterium]